MSDPPANPAATSSPLGDDPWERLTQALHDDPHFSVAEVMVTVRAHMQPELDRLLTKKSIGRAYVEARDHAQREAARADKAEAELIEWTNRAEQANLQVSEREWARHEQQQRAEQAEANLEVTRLSIERVRAAHRTPQERGDPEHPTCSCGLHSPCPTRRALDQPAQEGDRGLHPARTPAAGGAGERPQLGDVLPVLLLPRPPRPRGLHRMPLRPRRRPDTAVSESATRTAACLTEVERIMGIVSGQHPAEYVIAQTAVAQVLATAALVHAVRELTDEVRQTREGH